MCGRSDEEEVREKEKEKVDIAEEFASADEVDAASLIEVSSNVCSRKEQQHSFSLG